MQVKSNGAVKMLASMKDHKSAVNAIAVSPRTGSEAVSASSDGCCIVWDLETMKRRTSFYSNTFFKSVSYHPDESQVQSLPLSACACFGATKDMNKLSMHSVQVAYVVDHTVRQKTCTEHAGCHNRK
jgi:WD40 repeat protein